MPNGTCSVDGCSKPDRARGWCPAHWRRWRLYGDPLGSASSTATAVCTVDECGRPHIARGFCTLHYARWQKHGDPLYTIPGRTVWTCTIEGCAKPLANVGRGWCAAHYAKARKYGDPLARRYGLPVNQCVLAGCDKPGTKGGGFGWCAMHHRRYQKYGSPFVTSRIVGDDVSRFETYIRQGPLPAHAPELGPCWLWIGALTTDGYASMGVLDLPTDSGHRWSYRYHVGPLLEGLELDHLCVITNCVNPWHLDLVTHAENLRRANARKAAAA